MQNGWEVWAFMRSVGGLVTDIREPNQRDNLRIHICTQLKVMMLKFRSSGDQTFPAKTCLARLQLQFACAEWCQHSLA